MQGFYFLFRTFGGGINLEFFRDLDCEGQKQRYANFFVKSTFFA